ncbi:MAG: uroporphyrinogen-III synthase [Acidobacteria bacterium]|nr:uroporphyrinogen-III synthase [Acidobacteriota bacterium]
MKPNESKTTAAQSHERENRVITAAPLLHKTVLLTRPREQAEAMTARLEELGAHVLHAPMIALTEPDSWAALDAAIKQLPCYDWILFTSANGVNFFLQRLSQHQHAALAALTRAQVCAIGTATAQALAAADLNAEVIAAEATAEGLLQSLVAHLGDETALRGLRFLIPRARLAREVLPEALRSFGAQVDTVEAYQNMPTASDTQTLLPLLQTGAIDVITFTSSSTVVNFAALFGGENLAQLLQPCLIACIGPITAATASAYHLQNIIQPSVFNTPALVEAIVDAIGKK